MDMELSLETLKELAVEKAIEGNFCEAIELNLKILKINPDDTEALMQLAHAYWQSGEINLAIKYYKKALQLEPNNTLAKKRLLLLKPLMKKTHPNPNRKKGRVVPITDLIEEPGKTKTVKLANIGKPEHISLLSIGEEVFINIRKRKLEIRDLSANFIGHLPDDVSKRLIQLIKKKCKYEAFIFSIDKNEVKVFIREIKKPTKLKNVSSFVYEEIQPQKLEDDEEGAVVETEEIDEVDIDSDELLIPSEKETSDMESEEDSEEEDEYQEYEE